MIALVVTRLEGIVFMKHMIAIILLCSVSLTTKPKMNQQTLLISVPFLANVALDQIGHYQILCDMTIINDEFWNRKTVKCICCLSAAFEKQQRL